MDFGVREDSIGSGATIKPLANQKTREIKKNKAKRTFVFNVIPLSHFPEISFY
jgi:hypothetical protein